VLEEDDGAAEEELEGQAKAPVARTAMVASVENCIFSLMSG